MTEEEFLNIQKKTWIFYKYNIYTTIGPVNYIYMLISDVNVDGSTVKLTRHMTIRKIKSGVHTDEHLIYHKTPKVVVLGEFWYKKKHVQKYLSEDTLESIFRAIFDKRYTVS